MEGQDQLNMLEVLRIDTGDAELDQVLAGYTDVLVGDNEIVKMEVLVLNLLRKRELIDRIYGFEAHERIFPGMYADNYCRYNCNNISDLPEVASHPPAENSDRSQSRRESISFKETTECYFQ